MRNSCRIILRLAAWLVLGLPLAGFAQGTNTITTTVTTASAIGPSNAVQVTTVMFVGPQTILTGALGLCTASCTIGPGGTCGVSRPVLTGCAGGTPFVIAPGGVDFDTLTLTQITAAQATPQAVPLSPWVPMGSALGLALLAILWRLQRVRR
jgi:hypothetical protein